MGFNYVSAIFLLVIATVVAAGLAETVVVGGSEVFKYDPPSKESRPHSVYLLPNLYSYATCDFSSARLLSNPNEADGNGFSYVLNQWRPQYFASGEGDGSDCKEGLMKFFAVPLPRWFN
ncbi:UNVERIFIED_CONTAM: hypothetical protein Scaly_1584700 [Sesamum calycinum]|uniref:Phytocyanin domain-containing protein n=1 Tax=Sesamum calycinum TaxID=2727403 RepID=A0AAW2P743_9LAMI